MTRGFSTIEILIAMAIGVIIMTGVIGASFGNQSYLVASATNDDAVSIGKAATEGLRALGRQDFDLVNATSSTVTRGAITYTSVTTVQLLADYLTKAATTTVSWIGEHGQSLSTAFTTIITDLSNVNSPSSCNSGMSNPDGWKSPQNTAFDFQQLLYGNNSNGLVLTSIFALYQRLYVVAGSPPSNPNDAETFFVLDISGASPTFLGSLDNDTDNGSTYGLNDVTVASSSSHFYAFLANNHDNDFYACAQSSKCAQLQVVDATSPAAPPGWTPASVTLKLATSSAPYVYGNHPSASGQAVGNAVAYANGYLYLGLTTTQSGAGFHVIDVHNPLSPVWVGSWPAAATMNGVSSGAPINAITVKGPYAYISHPSGLTGASTEQLTVLDISNPAAPTRVSGFSSATGASNAAGRSATVVGPKLYLGRTYSNTGAPDAIPEFFVLDANNPASISATPLGTQALGIDSEGINNLVVRSNLAFLLTTKQFKVINIANPAAITTWGSLALPGHGGSSFDCDGDRFFVIHDVNKDFVSIVTPSPPTDYTLSNSGNITVNPGGVGNTTITRTTVLNPVPVTLSISGLPAGATATWANNPCTPTCNSTLTISTTAATAPGTYPITITGSPNGTSNPSTTFNLVVTGFSYSLSTPGNVTVVRAGAAQNTSLTASLVSGATQTVTFSNSALPSGVTMNYSATSCNPTCTTTLTLSASAGAAVGAFPITITGTPGGLTTTFNVTVTAPAFSYTISDPGTFVLSRAAQPVPMVVTVTMNAGAVPQSVTLTAPTPGTTSLPLNPKSCTPSATAPYQCQVTFDYTATANGTFNNQVTTGTPNAVSSASYKIQVKN